MKDRVINALKGVPLSDFESALTPLVMAGLPKSTFHAKLSPQPLSAQNSYEEKFSGGQSDNRITILVCGSKASLLCY